MFRGLRLRRFARSWARQDHTARGSSADRPPPEAQRARPGPPEAQQARGTQLNNSRQAWAALLPVESGSYSTVSPLTAAPVPPQTRILPAPPQVPAGEQPPVPAGPPAAPGRGLRGWDRGSTGPGSGGPGGLRLRGSHRSGRAEFPHPAPRGRDLRYARVQSMRYRTRGGGRGYLSSTCLNRSHVIRFLPPRRPSHFCQALTTS